MVPLTYDSATTCCVPMSDWLYIKHSNSRYAYHVPTQATYQDDSDLLLRYKGLLLLVGTPIMLVKRVVYAALKTIYNLTICPFTIPFTNLTCRDWAVDTLHDFANLFRAPYYAILAELAALFMLLICPLEGRRLYNAAEAAYNRHDTIREECLTPYSRGETYHAGFYMAGCMIPIAYGSLYSYNCTDGATDALFLQIQKG